MAPAFEGIFNFRDYGGYATPDGRLIRGRLFRSGHHHRATPADLDLFGQSRVETVIDLRGDSERSGFPCARAEGFAADVLFAPGETDGRDPSIPDADLEDVAASTARMVAIYRLLPFVPALAGSYRLFLDALVERQGASMVHCFAGKDRTGIAVALVHRLTGVHRDDLMADYCRSSDPELIDRRVAAEGATVRARHRGCSDAALRRLFSVEPQFLDAAFAAMAERHGSIDNYARDLLAMTPARVDALREGLIA